MGITDIFNNREIAAGVWLLILLAWVLWKPEIRTAFLDVLEAFFAWKIVLPTMMMSLYVLLMVIVYEKIGFWDISALKDTIFWALGAAFVMLIHSNEAASDEHFFRNAVLDNIKLVLVLEFIVNVYSFDFWAELVIVPVVSLVAMMSVYAEAKTEYKQVKPFLDAILSILGIVILAFTIYEIVIDFHNFATTGTLRDFLLPLLFTTTFLPFIYFMALLVKYEDIFTRIDIFNTDKELAQYAKRRILIACHINLRKLSRCSKNIRALRFASKDDVLALVQRCQSNN